MEVVAHASWHLSFWGGTERIREKIEAYAHQVMSPHNFLV
jgi:hypothetical protein